MVFTSKGTSLDWSIACGSMLSSASTASFAPTTASGITELTSCAKKPSTVLLNPIKLNLAGLSCFSLVVASKV